MSALQGTEYADPGTDQQSTLRILEDARRTDAGATYTELAGCRTADGRKVARGPEGIIYALTELA